MIPIRNRRPIRLEIPSRGAAPKKTFGTGAYKFFVGAGFLLVPRGWTKLKKSRDYAFLRPPAGGPQGLPFVIDIDLPSREEVLELAEQRHAIGTEWTGRLGEWGVIYVPAHKSTMKLVDPFTDAPPVEMPEDTLVIPAHFKVGIPLIWTCWVDWRKGHRSQYLHTLEILYLE